MDLKKRIKKNKKQLKKEGIKKPTIDKNYWCETCGSKSGKCNPENGMCYICGDDNWKPTKNYNEFND